MIVDQLLVRTPHLLQSVLDTVPDAIVTANANGEVVMLNKAAARIFGHKQKAMLGKSMSMLMPERFRAMHERGMERFQATGEARVLNRTLNLFGLHASGKEFPIEVHITQTMVDGVPLFTAILTDTSERLAEEQRLRQAKEDAIESSRAKSSFLAAMSHEIRTPLNAVVGALTLMKDTGLSDEQLRLTRLAELGSQTLLDTVNDVLDFSKIEASGIQVDHVSFDMIRLVDGVIELFAARAAAKQLHVSFFIDPEIPRLVVGDPARIRQVLVNLVGNALKFTDRGLINIEVHLQPGEDEKESYLRFEVADTGIGIKPELQDKLFSEFMQVDFSLTRRAQGSGLGLAICAKIVNALGGMISVESEFSKGSRFFFTVPFTVDLSNTIGYISAPPGTATPVGLCIREQRLRDQIGRQLRAWGWKIELVPLASIDTLQSSPALYDCMVIDQSAWDRIAHARELPGRRMLVVSLLAQRHEGSHPVVEGRVTFGSPLTVSTLLEELYRAGGEKEDVAPIREVSEQELPAVGGELLLAEDSPANQFIARELLTRAGYSVDLANNGIEAVEAASRKRYDAILMDLQMPEMDGLEASRNIRQIPGDVGSVPIIAMTANVYDQIRHQVEEAGMTDFVPKPVNRDDLLKVLRKHISLSLERTITGGALDEESLNALRQNIGERLFVQSLSIFLSELEQRLGEIIKANEAGDVESIALNADAIRSGASTFGAHSLVEESANIQSLATDSLLLDLDAALPRMVKVAKRTAGSLAAVLADAS